MPGLLLSTKGLGWPRTCLHFNVAGDGMDQFHAIFWMGLETMFYSVVPGHAFGPFLRAWFWYVLLNYWHYSFLPQGFREKFPRLQHNALFSGLRVEGGFARRCAWGPDAVLMGVASKKVTFEGFQRWIGSFRVAGTALRGIPTCFITYGKSFFVTVANNVFPSFSEDEWIFSCQTSIVILRIALSGLRQVVTTCKSPGRRGTLCHFAWQAQYLVQIRSVWNVMRDKHSNSDTLIDTLHSTLYTPHLTLSTPHFTLHTWHFTLHTLHFTL